MPAVTDRNPHHYIPLADRQRTDAWRVSATNLVFDRVPFLSMAVERLMFAERPLLEMEARLVQHEIAMVQNEPLLLMECSSLAMLWICGLYEVTRLTKAARNPKWESLSDLHRRLSSLRMPIAKHEVKGKPALSHYPTSVWEAESGKVGWSIYNPDTDSYEVYTRAQLADEFLFLTAQLNP